MEEFRIEKHNPILLGKKLAEFGMPTNLSKRLASMACRVKPEAEKLVIITGDERTKIKDYADQVVAFDFEGQSFRPNLDQELNRVLAQADILLNGEIFVSSPDLKHQFLGMKLRVSVELDTYFKAFLKALSSNSPFLYRRLVEALFNNCVPTAEGSIQAFFNEGMKKEVEIVFVNGYYHFVVDFIKALKEVNIEIYDQDHGLFEPFNLFFASAKGGCKDSRYVYLRGRLKAKV